MTHLLYFLQIIIALLAVPLVFYIPGAVLLTHFQQRSSQERHFLLSLAMGFSFFILTHLLFAYLQIPSLWMFLMGSMVVWYYKQHNLTQDLQCISQTIRVNRLATLIIVIGSLLFVSLNFKSGLLLPDVYGLYGTNARDGVLHLALSKSMSEHFPPLRPGLANQSLQGYHYFYPFVVGRLHLLFNFAVEDLLFRIFPVFIAVLYGSAWFLISRRNHLVTWFAYLGYGIIPLIPNLYVGFTGMQYPLTLVHNPSTLLAISLFLVALHYLSHLKNFTIAIAIGLTIGVLANLKVYTGILALLTLTTFLFLRGLGLNRKHTQIPPLLVTFFISLLLTFFTFYLPNHGSGTLIWAPLRYYDHFMEQQSLSHLEWAARKQVYLENQNLLGLYGRIYPEAILLFFSLNLGLRLVILLRTHRLFQQRFYADNLNVVFFISLLVCLTLPSLFIQSVAVFDIGQFFWHASVLLSYPFGICLTYFVTQAARLPKSLAQLSIFILIVFFSLPGVLGYLPDAKRYLLEPPFLSFSQTDMAVFAHAQMHTLPYEYLIVGHLFGENKELKIPDTPIVSAMTSRSVYYEKELTPFRESSEVSKRIAAQQQLAQALKHKDCAAISTQLQDMGSMHLITTAPISCPQIRNQLTGSQYSYSHWSVDY